MGKFKTTYPKKFALFSTVYFILIVVVIAVIGFEKTNLDLKLLITTVLIIYFNSLSLEVSKNFRLSFNIPIMFYIFLLYPLKFILPFSFVLLLFVSFIKKMMQTRNYADGFIISFFLSSVETSYILGGIYVFRFICSSQFLYMGIIQIFALSFAFLSMEFLNSVFYYITNNLLMQNSFTKNDLIVLFYSTLSDLTLLILFLPLYILAVNDMSLMALFYIGAIYVLIRIFYKILSVRVDILMYVDLLKKLNNLKYDIDDYFSIEKSLIEYLKLVKSSIYLENVYYYRKTYEGILEFTPDDKKIFKYLIPEIHSIGKILCKVYEIKKGEIKHYPYKVLYLGRCDSKSEIGGLLLSLRLNNSSSYLLNYLKILFDRLNAILDLHLDRRESGRLLSNIISILISSIEGSSKDAVTHSKRVAIIASGIAEKLGYSKEEIELFRYAGLLHDIGIVTYSRSIYAKKNKSELTEEEWNMIKKHPLVGYNVLKNIKLLGDVPVWILEHHERYDGNGFPYGKKGDDISEGGMILNLANVYDSFLFGKSYINKVPVDMAIKYIVSGQGTIFNPVLLDKIKPYLEGIARQMIKNIKH